MNRRQVVGVCVGQDVVTTALTVRGTVVTKSRRSCGGDVSMAGALRQSLTAVRPKRRWRRTACHVTLEPSLVQVHRIAEMPRVASAPERLAMLALTSGEHFLGDVESLSIVLGDGDSDGSVWAMALDRDLLEVIETEVRAAGLVLRGLAPAIDLLAAIARPDEHEVCRSDANGVTAYGRVENGRLSETWRSSTHVDPPECISCNASLDETADNATNVGHSEMAVVAALAGTRARFGTQSRRRSAGWSLSVPIRYLMAIASCFTVADLITPGLRARRDANSAADAIEAISPSIKQAVLLRHRADSLHRLEHQVAQFRASGVSVLRVLSQLSEALSDESYVTALTIDSVSIQASFAAPRATELLASFAKFAEFDSVTLVGAVSREIQAGAFNTGGPPIPRQAPAEARSVERVSLRFVMRPPDTTLAQRSRQPIAPTDRKHAAGFNVAQRERQQ